MDGGSRSNKSRIKTFKQYEAVVRKTDEKKSRMISMLGLVGEVGDLNSRVKKFIIQRGANESVRSEIKEEFGDLLWYLTSLANLHGISLQEIADENAKKAELLFLEGRRQSFDFGFPKDERFPRKFTATFREKPVKQGVCVRISVGGVTIGDALTDNSHKKDGYRFHDVFHLAYAAVLGWSPVTRALLKCKRKSRPQIDEVEDGARAAIIEEAISLLVFNHAEARGYYVEPSSVDLGLLKTIRRMVNGLEVEKCTAKQWQSAIRQGFSAFLQLKNNKGGRVIVDLDRQSVLFDKQGV